MKIFRCRRVAGIRFDFAITIQLDDGSELRLENDFRLQLPDGNSVHVPVSDFGPTAEQLLKLFNCIVNEAEYDDTGMLILTFDNNSIVSVLPHDSYEAWNYAGMDGKKLVCMPGGSIAIWDKNGSA